MIAAPNGVRWNQLVSCVPDIVKPRTCLYVGGSIHRLQFLNELLWSGCVVDLVEIFDPYVKGLQEWNAKTARLRTIIHGNLMDLPKLVQPRAYELVMWWHGPEHVDPASLAQALAAIEHAASEIIVVGAPHGRCGQGVTKDGNVHQRHLNHLMGPELKALGYQVNTLLGQPSPASHLIGWKRVSEQ